MRQKKQTSRHHSIPASEFNMEDGAIQKSTLQEIQSFFGLSDPLDSLPNPKGALEHKYSPAVMNSGSDSNSPNEVPPKDANQAVSPLDVV